jgi:hypothetical protein
MPLGSKPDVAEIEWALQLLVCADNVNLLEDNINTIKKNSEVLIDATKEGRLEVNTQKTKCMFMSSPYCRAKS